MACAPQVLHNDLETLRRMVPWIQAVLTDAEEMEIHDQSVKLWLSELRGIAYDAEDVLDQYEYELLRRQMEVGVQPPGEPAHLPNNDQQQHQEGRFKIWKRWRRKAADRPSSQNVGTRELAVASITSDASYWGKTAGRIRKIGMRFDKISKQRDALQLREGGEDRQFQIIESRQPTNHLVDAPTIFVRWDDLEKVIDQLLCSDEVSTSNLSVLPIVGMGGVGKTTLVQHIYNDPRVLKHFPMRGWVCVSDDINVQRLTSSIIKSFTNEECCLNEFSMLQERLVNILLDGNRFLLVLDDVWDLDQRHWESLQTPLVLGAKGSVVITTTRDESIARIMQTMAFHSLDCLSTDDCWKVFRESAFVDRVPDDHPDLIKIGYQIVEKCKGLPLAAKSVGSLLCYENDVTRWEEVLHSNIWNLGGAGADKIIPALRLSYLYLPSNLKPCFVYTALFPKDFIFQKEELIQLWMAQGFLRCKGNKEAEDVGTMYFNGLVQRSFFQYHGETRTEDSNFVMHDLIHDLAQHISEQEFFHMQGVRAHVLLPNEKVRHLSILGQSVRDLAMMLLSLTHNYYAVWAPIRTLRIRQVALDWTTKLEFPREMMLHLEFLRVLDLRSSSVFELPESVGNLKLLRYLNLGSTEIGRLPDSVWKLYNLQTLRLEGCANLGSLPKDIGGLCNLRCLKIDRINAYFLPRSIGKLTNLHALDEVLVGRNWWGSRYKSGWTEGIYNLLQISDEECIGIEDLKDLIHLRGSLRISNLSVVKNAEHARLADLRNKRDIRKLFLIWSKASDRIKKGGISDEYASLDVQTKVMENLQPPDRLEYLKIVCYDGYNFPSWMGDDPLTSPSKLVRVHLFCCGCTSLPALGQLPSLKYLEMESMEVQAIGPEFCGYGSVGFPALEELQFLDMDGWVKWELAAERGTVVFPSLRYLSLFRCPNLESVAPLYLLPALEKLAIYLCQKLECIELQSSSPSSCSSSSPASSPTGLKSLRSMSIKSCPRARFLPDDDEGEQSLLLPTTLRALDIDWASPLLVDWCDRGGGSRVAHIPNAKVWNIGNGQKIVATWANVPTTSMINSTREKT